MTLQETYRCPGESYDIAPQVHLGRLANFYDKCLACPHRHETGSLSRRRVRHLQLSRERTAQRVPEDDEGLRGVLPGEMTSALVRDWSAAFGLQLLDSGAGSIPSAMIGLSAREPATPYRAGTTQVDNGQSPRNARRPRVLLGSDARAISGELVAAAAEGLRWSGCDVLHAGGVTAAGLAWLQRSDCPDGALLIGNPLGLTYSAGVRAWDADGMALSLGHGLEAIRAALPRVTARPTRRFGDLASHAGDGGYRDSLEEFFHALRPLKFVFLTTSLPAIEHLTRLLSRTGAQALINPDPAPAFESRSDGSSRPSLKARESAPSVEVGLPKGMKDALAGAPSSWEAETLASHIRRLQALVAHSEAHFGIWLDGDGERLLLVDERCQPIETRTLLARLVDYFGDESSAAKVVWAAPDAVARPRGTPGRRAADGKSHGDPPRGSSNRLQERFIRSAAATRGAMQAAMRAHGAILGGDAGGRLWFGNDPPQCDGLRTLALLLTLLSQSDQRVSAALSDATTA